MITIRKPLIALLSFAAMLALTLPVSCTKETPVPADTVEVSPSVPSGDEPAEPSADQPSKYRPEDLLTVTFTADAESTKTTLGESGSGAGGTGRSITWNLGDRVTFVWGEEAEDRSVGEVTSMSDDGKRATFTVERVYAGAKAIYAVYPSGAFSSFTKGTGYDTDGEGTVRVRVGAMADGSRPDGSFGEADVCIGRSSLENGKMKFKHLVAFVSMTATNPATKYVRMDGGSVPVGGILPVTATVGEDGFTQTPVIGGVEAAGTVTTVASAGLNQTTYIPVLADLSFASGIALSYLDASDNVVGEATLRKNTSVSLGSVLTFPASVNKSFSRDWYVKSTADGSGDGTSWDKAWNYAQMRAYTSATNHYETDLTVNAPVNVHIAAGTYYINDNEQLLFRHQWTDNTEKVLRQLNIIGGYPAAPSADSTPDPDVNATIFDCSCYIPNDASNSNAAVQVQSRGIINVSGLRFVNRSGKKTGATAFAIWANAAAYKLCSHISKCRFSGNTNTGVGAGFRISTSGTEIAEPEIVLEDCVFSDNEAGAGAGLNADAGQVTIKNCTFSGNKVHAYANTQSSGAAVKVGHGDVHFEGCTFSGNYLMSGAIGFGGALWISDESEETLSDYTVTVDDCHFTGNYTLHAHAKGGAVFVQRYRNVVFNRCDFSNNAVGDATTACGGAMLVGCKTTSTQSHSADDVSVTLNDCVFDGNRVPNTLDDGSVYPAGGAVYLYQPAGKTVTLSMNRCEIKNHTLTDGLGGGIYAESGTLTLQACDIHHNTLSSSSFWGTGAALYAKDADCTLSGSSSAVQDMKIRDNTSSGGGAIMLNGTGDMEMTDCLVSGNTGARGGAAMRISSTDKDMTFTRVAFTGNVSSGGNSGAVAIYKNTDAHFQDCTFTDNSSSIFRGGAVYVSGEDGATNSVFFSGCTFSGNYGTTGGAIYIGNADNAAYTDSGKSTPATTLAATGYYDSCRTSLSVDNCTFCENYATNGSGGAIAVATSGAVSITSSRFTGNYTETSNWYNSGGAVSLRYGQAGDSVTAGVVSNPVRLVADITDCTFIDNKTAVQASYNYAYGGAIALMRGTILQYKDDAKGDDGMYADNYVLARVNRCNFIHNYASQGGAIGLYNSSSDLYVSNSLFYRNYIEYRAGSIINRRGPTGLHINNSTFHNAWAKGGANCAYFNLMYDGVFTLANSTVIGVPQKAEGSEDTDNGEALVRFDGITHPEKFHFINSIVCSTNAVSGRAFTGYNSTVTLANTHPDANGRGFLSTKASPAVTASGFSFTLPASDTGESVLTAYATSANFGALAWQCDASSPTYLNTYWYWNGILGSGMGGKSALSDMNVALDNSDPDFYAWLVSIGDVGADHASGRDQRGATRASVTMPGAYAGMDMVGSTQDVSRETVTLTD